MKISKVIFGDPPFRMLGKMKIEISDRITAIAGHNGVGKSTILGLIANGSEIKRSQGATMFNRAFQAQFHELFVLDEKSDYIDSRKQKPYVKLVYSDEGKTDLVKTCSVSKHSETKKVKGELPVVFDRLKIVPRGKMDGWNVTDASKVHIPTMFLSISRMLPLGENQDKLIASIQSKMDEDDESYIRDNFKAVIDNKVVDSKNITKQEISGTTKRSLLPEFQHPSKTISLGQDSLSSIITALASFNRLKREHSGTYHGGILLIDEIEDGFHPRAQAKLVQLLKQEAKKLKLQIIVTTHSLTIIKEIYNLGQETSKGGGNIDSVVYIQNAQNPSVMQNPTYEKIRDDMLNVLPSNKSRPTLKIYFEDDEAKWFFEKVLKAKKVDLSGIFKCNFKLIGSKLGCGELLGLREKDDYYKSVLIILDGDAIITHEEGVKKYDNVLTLPYIDADRDDSTTYSPEYQLYLYTKKIVDDSNHILWSSVKEGYHQENIKDRVVDSFPLNSSGQGKKRGERKDWFKEKQECFEDVDIIKYFCKDNATRVNKFIKEVKKNIQSLINGIL